MSNLYFSDFLREAKANLATDVILDPVRELLSFWLESVLCEYYENDIWMSVVVRETRAVNSSLVVPYVSTGKTTMSKIWLVSDADPFGSLSVEVYRGKKVSDGVFFPDLASGDLPYVLYTPVRVPFIGNEYVAATTYVVGNVVFLRSTGEYYKCILNSTGNAPTNATYWERVSVSEEVARFAFLMAVGYYMASLKDERANVVLGRANDLLIDAKMELNVGNYSRLRAYIQTYMSEQSR